MKLRNSHISEEAPKFSHIYRFSTPIPSYLPGKGCREGGGVAEGKEVGVGREEWEREGGGGGGGREEVGEVAGRRKREEDQ